MATFLQRIGRQPLVKPMMAFDEMDDQLRHALWNALIQHVWSFWTPPNLYSQNNVGTHDVEGLVQEIWSDLFHMPLDKRPPTRGDGSAYDLLRRIVMDHPWHEVYNLVDFVVSAWAGPIEPLVDALNRALEKNSAAWRFVNKELVQVTSPIEIAAIEGAISRSSKEVRTHLEASLRMLADRDAPDYRNSIKEAISAVECAAQAVAGRPGATLNDCLKRIKQDKAIHPAYEQALIKLYAYSSDAGGIRHALTEDGVVPTQADAQFMLVSCSAFTNYLWSLAAESRISI